MAWPGVENFNASKNYIPSEYILSIVKRRKVGGFTLFIEAHVYRLLVFYIDAIQGVGKAANWAVDWLMQASLFR
jgi:hypothetical protein